MAVADGPRAVVIDGPPLVVVNGSLSAFDSAAADAALAGPGNVALAAPGTYELVGVAISDFPFESDVSTAARTVQALVGLADQVDLLGGQASLEVASSVARRARIAVVSNERVRNGLAATLDLFG
jgi:hypothetical protein